MAGAGVYLPASEVALILRFGELQKSMVMLVGSVAVLSCRFLMSCILYRVLNFWLLLLPCRRTGLVI